MSNTAQNDSFQATPVGFSVTHERERREFREQDVQGIRLETRRDADILENVTLQESLHVRVRDDQGERWVDLVAEVGPWDQDPLRELRERLLNNLLERSCEVLLNAGDVEGPGWSLSLIHFCDRASGRSCPPQQISAVRWSGDQLCVFHENEREPFAKYDRQAENTILLYRIFDQLLDGVCQDAEVSSSNGLGALRQQLTAIESHWLTPRRFALLAAVPAAAMVYALPISIAGTGILLMLLVFLVVMPLLKGTFATLRLYERAVVWTCGNDESVMLLNQVTSLTATHSAAKDADGAVVPRLELQFSSDNRDVPSIGFRTQITPENREMLESIVLDTAKVIAATLRDKLDQDGQVAWTEQLTICDDMFVCRPHPDSPPQCIARRDIQGWSLSDTVLRIVLPTGDSVSMLTSCPNFYPGLIVLHERGWFKSSAH